MKCYLDVTWQNCAGYKDRWFPNEKMRDVLRRFGGPSLIFFETSPYNPLGPSFANRKELLFQDWNDLGAKLVTSLRKDNIASNHPKRIQASFSCRGCLKGNNPLPTIHFQVPAFSFRDGICFDLGRSSRSLGAPKLPIFVKEITPDRWALKA